MTANATHGTEGLSEKDMNIEGGRMPVLEILTQRERKGQENFVSFLLN